MGTDQLIEAITSPSMKFAICILAFALMATIEAAPATESGLYGSETAGDGSKYFANQLDGVQGALVDIEAAGTDLNTIETKLEALVDGSAKVYAAETALETAVDSAAYANAFAAPSTDVVPT